MDMGETMTHSQAHARDHRIPHLQRRWATRPGNISYNPLFVDPDGIDNVVGTVDDNLRLSNNSPCIDAGNNDCVLPDIADLDNDGDMVEKTPIDRDGNPRFVNDPATPDTGNGTPPIVDMGAYEFQGPFIPAVSEWGLAAMALLVLTAGTLVLKHRRRVSRAAG